jgi:hypothetical protein
MKEGFRMDRSRYAIVLTGIAWLCSITQAPGESGCQPTLTFKEVRFSEIRAQQRTWTAVIAVDASRCATTFGRFSINFTRLKETAPDLLFTEQLAWHPGRVEVSLNFWADEAVLDYSIGQVAPCACAAAIHNLDDR